MAAEKTTTTPPTMRRILSSPGQFPRPPPSPASLRCGYHFRFSCVARSSRSPQVHMFSTLRPRHQSLSLHSPHSPLTSPPSSPHSSLPFSFVFSRSDLTPPSSSAVSGRLAIHPWRAQRLHNFDATRTSGIVRSLVRGTPVNVRRRQVLRHLTLILVGHLLRFEAVVESDTYLLDAHREVGVGTDHPQHAPAALQTPKQVLNDHPHLGVLIIEPTHAADVWTVQIGLLEGNIVQNQQNSDKKGDKKDGDKELTKVVSTSWNTRRGMLPQVPCHVMWTAAISRCLRPTCTCPVAPPSPPLQHVLASLTLRTYHKSSESNPGIAEDNFRSREGSSAQTLLVRCGMPRAGTKRKRVPLRP